MSRPFRENHDSSPRPLVRNARQHRLSQILFALLERLHYGGMVVTTPDGSTQSFGSAGDRAVPFAAGAAHLVINDWSAIASAMRGGDVGFAEAYIDGRVDTPDLVQLLTVLAANQPALERMFYGRLWMRALLRLRHLFRSNTVAQARRNIVAHYDLGNPFYALWLDPSMTYSAACFGGDYGQDLQHAQQAKYERALGELELDSPSQLLEVGCGWGGFAETAARSGHSVTGISLSSAQTQYAQARLHDAQLAQRAQCRIQDYRQVTGQYDGIVSIEMIEAVGERYWPDYFATIARLLKHGARACIQAITIADERFERYRTQSDFIQRFIFPGGMLLSPARLQQEAERAGLRVLRSHRFGQDYAETLKRWLRAFDDNTPRIRALGFDRRFIRCWRFYLAYCAAGFATETTDVGQYTLVHR
jgi:cyclopropane-fatty-acyl-phospholipid synthase